MPTKTITRAFSQSLNSYHKAAIAQKQIAKKLFLLIKETNTYPSKAMEIGTGSGLLSKLLLEKYPHCSWFLNDLIPYPEISQLQKNKNITPIFIAGNAEEISFPTSLDFITSSSTLQWFKNLPLFLNKCTQALETEGQIAFSTFGVENFNEIRALTQKGLSYITLEQWQRLLEKDFTNIKLSEEKIILHFPSALDVLKHLKATGVNAGSRLYKTRSQLQYFIYEYEMFFKTNKGVSLTYHPIYIQATKK